MTDAATLDNKNTICVAFCGNSMLYFNDCPRVLCQLLSTDTTTTAAEGTCLRGGASLATLWKQGNGMAEKFTAIRDDEDIGAATVSELLSRHKWDYCILNDHTQGPMRDNTMEESKAALTKHYAPLLKENGAVPIVMQTPAYRNINIPYTKELATTFNFAQWTDRVRRVTRNEYATVLPQPCRWAPVGDAYATVRAHDKGLWEKLYYRDDFHPSPHGTWLMACVLYCVVMEVPPPPYSDSVWKDGRYRQRPEHTPMEFPTIEEAEQLRQYACETCSNILGGDEK